MDFFEKKEWTEQDVQFLIDNNVEESIHIEFKGAGGLFNNDHIKTEIAKDVSAFANSDGGFIFYGIDEKDHKADSVDFIDGDAYTKEWLELVIASQISKRVEVIIYPVRFDGDVKKSVYVVKIPLSYSAPHQVNKNKLFYRRYNFQAVPMAEYEVRQCYERKENVKLEITSCNFIERKPAPIRIYDTFIISVGVYAKNVGSVVANEFKCVASFKLNTNYEILTQGADKYIYSKLANKTTVSTSQMFPIFPDETIEIMRFEIVCQASKINEVEHFFDIALLYGNTKDESNWDFTDNYIVAMRKLKWYQGKGILGDL